MIPDTLARFLGNTPPAAAAVADGTPAAHMPVAEPAAELQPVPVPADTGTAGPRLPAAVDESAFYAASLPVVAGGTSFDLVGASFDLLMALGQH